MFPAACWLHRLANSPWERWRLSNCLFLMVLEKEEGYHIAWWLKVWYKAEDTHNWTILRNTLSTHSLLLLSPYGFLASEGRGHFKGLDAVQLNLGFHLPSVTFCNNSVKEGFLRASLFFPPLMYVFELCLFVLTPGKWQGILSKYLLLQASTPAGTVRASCHVLCLYAVRLKCNAII